MRPGTSRMGKKVTQQAEQDDDAWANQDVYLP